METYSSYLKLNEGFESVVDISAEQRNPNLWREYIVGDDMETLVEFLCKSLGNEGPDMRRSFIVQGSYGTGKSYAALFVKHLLEEPPEVIDQYLANSSRLAQYRNRFMKCRRNGDYLVIWKTGCAGMRTGDMMLLEAEQAVREALIAKFGPEADLGSASLGQTVRDRLNDGSINWDYLLQTTTLGDDYSSVDELREKVASGDIEALQRTAAVIRARGWGLINNFKTFKEWIASVIDANGLSKSGIFFIWDEFTEYVLRSTDHTVIQQMSEFTKEKPLYMFFVVHTVQELTDQMGKDAYQRIVGRFHTVQFHINSDMAFDLIQGSFTVKNNCEE